VNLNGTVDVIGTVDERAQPGREAVDTAFMLSFQKLIDPEHYTRGVELLERVVAMLTKLIDP
jgi:hypothetical protein